MPRYELPLSFKRHCSFKRETLNLEGVTQRFRVGWTSFVRLRCGEVFSGRTWAEGGRWGHRTSEADHPSARSLALLPLFWVTPEPGSTAFPSVI